MNQRMGRSTRVNSATSSGAVLGAANAAVIALGIAVTLGHGVGLAAFAIVTAIGLIPAMVAGLAIGRLAASLDHRPIVRFTALAACGVATVAVVGTVFGLPGFIVPACVPTLVAVSILERSTRGHGAIPRACASSRPE